VGVNRVSRVSRVGVRLDLVLVVSYHS